MNKRKKKKVFLGPDRVLGNALKHFREISGLSQTEAAKRTELSQSAISRFEDGDNWPCKETTFRFCHVYGISILELFRFITDDLSESPPWALEITVIDLDEEEKENERNK